MFEHKEPTSATNGNAADVEPTVRAVFREIEHRLGVVPHFFERAGDDPAVARGLWQVAQHAYLNVPANPLAREQLFTYLSKFCGARYCVARHMAFLLKRDRDKVASASPRMDPVALERLLSDPLPDAAGLRRALDELRSSAPLDDWPAFDAPLGRSFRDVVAVTFVNPQRAEEAIAVLQRLLGPAGYERLLLFLGFVRFANFWSEGHPEIPFEADVEALLGENEPLAHLVAAIGRDESIRHDDPDRSVAEERTGLRREIAALRATEAILAARIRHLDVVADTAPLLIAQIDRDRRYRYVNRRYAEFFGWEPAELIGRTVREVIGERAYASAAPHLDAALAGREVEFHAEVTGASNEPRWLRTSYSPLCEAGGRVSGLVAGISDVTAHRLVEQARIESEARLLAAQAASGIGIYEWDIENDLLIWDARLRELWGVTQPGALPFSVFVDGLHPDDLFETRRSVERALDPEGTGDYEAEYRVVNARTGRIAWVHATGRVEFVAGRAIRMLGAVVDVTARREAEEASAVSEARLKLAAEAAGFGTYYQNLATGELDWSPEARAIVGLRAEEPIGIDRVLQVIHPDDRDRVHAKVRAHLRGGGGPEFVDEYRIVLPDGSVRWILVKGRRYGSSAAAGDGDPPIAAGTILDITDRKLAEERQTMLLNELDHRVKNMLTIVQSLATQTIASKNHRNGAFMEVFSARLRALAGAHDLLTRGGWAGATLAEVVDAALTPFATPGEGRIRFPSDGPQVCLSPNAAVTLSLAFHELGTNATKHGALSVPQGYVELDWSQNPAATPQWVEVTWIERRGPAVVPPEHRGFGSRLIERALAREFDGEARIEYPERGVECRMRLALSERVRIGS